MKLNKDYLIVFFFLGFFLGFLVFANAISLSTWGNSLDMLRPVPFILDLALFIMILGTYANRRLHA
jgi:hypothetical protein